MPLHILHKNAFHYFKTGTYFNLECPLLFFCITEWTMISRSSEICIRLTCISRLYVSVISPFSMTWPVDRLQPPWQIHHSLLPLPPIGQHNHFVTTTIAKSILYLSYLPSASLIFSPSFTISLLTFSLLSIATLVHSSFLS